MSNIQLSGAFMAAPAGETLVNRSVGLTSVTINKGRNAVTEPADIATARESEKAGTKTESVTLRFHSTLAASSFWAELYDIIDTDDAEMDFTCTLNPGVRGADNPEFAGTVVLLNLETGADVGTLRQQSITLPVTAAGISKNVTPV